MISKKARTILAISLLFILSVPLIAGEPDAGSVALAVLDDDPTLDAQVSAALESTDPGVRAIAARIATTRKRSSLLPLIEQKAGSEPDAEAARELVRSLVLLGGRSEIDRALAVTERFEHRLDGAVASAVARLGTADALDIYKQKLSTLPGTPRSNFFKLALWGSPQLLSPTGARVLGERNPRTWGSFLGAIQESQLSVDPGILIAAMRDRSDEIRAKTIHFIFENEMGPRKTLDPRLSDFLKEVGDREASDSLLTSFELELLRRLAREKPREKTEWLLFLRSDGGASVVRWLGRAKALLTAKEIAVLPRDDRKIVTASRSSLPLQPVRRAEFFLPSDLPAGTANAVLRATGCRSQYLGIVKAAVDRQGRVSTIDTSSLEADVSCRRAVETFLRLSLAVNQSVTSGFSTDQIILVKAAGASVCLDEAKVPAAGESDVESCAPFTLTSLDEQHCKPPVVRKRIEPKFTVPAQRSMVPGQSSIVILEAFITEKGCVRNADLLAQSPLGDLNREALIAVTQWLFDPAIIDGRPYPVLFHLTINFKTR